MLRNKQLADRLKISIERLKSYYDLAGLDFTGSNQSVSQEAELLLQKIIAAGEDPKAIESAKRQYFHQINHTFPKEFDALNPFKDDFQLLLSSDINFSKRMQHELSLGEEIIKTVFSDFEAFSVCKGLKNAHARHIASKFFQGQSTEEMHFEAHQIANEALLKYGDELLSFCVSLPSLPFKPKELDVFSIFSEMDKRKKTFEHPVLRIAFKNEQGIQERISISFYKERDSDNKPNTDVLIVKNKSTNSNALKISRSGLVLPLQGKDKHIPIIRLLVSFSKDTKTYTLNYGLETGECSICGRPLTDDKSILKGIGPVCEAYL